MADSNKSYRVRTNIGQDTSININLNQDFDILEILSLKISRENMYKLHTSKYGCIAGRVLGNETFGIPNAKISIFIAADSLGDDTVISSMYPYSSVSSTTNDGVRYNLLPEEQVSDCHTPVGSFPSKRLMLDDDTVLEIFDKYYKYTTRTNNAGDYMLFGIPVGTQMLHVDIDLSDIGVLSQKPIDLIYKGYDINQFESPSQFKKDTNIDNLAQIITDNYSLDVKPFWGDNTSGMVSITRQDIKINYKFEPTCVFIGSIITDSKSNGISKECNATDKMGKMNELTTGSGTIEMIRKKLDGTVEEFSIKATQLINGNGTWCYQIPMNLDYMSTDEYGNLVPSEDPTKGIPTRTRVRFRVSLTDYESDYANNHLAKVLVPNNPKTYEDLDYVFGTNTKDDKYATKSFRDLFWNNVYTVKTYIPRVQNGDKPNRNKHFTGFKQINVYDGNNPLPYNNVRIDINFTFMLVCALIKTLIFFITCANGIISALGSMSSTSKSCLTIGGGMCDGLENFWFAPNCRRRDLKKTFERMTADSAVNAIKDPYSVDDRNADTTDDVVCLTRKMSHFKQCIEVSLAMEYNVIQFDFYNDWINGMLYIPRWFMVLRKKRSWLFGLIKRKAKIQACMESTFNKRRNLVQQCSLAYTSDANGNFTKVVTPNGCKNTNKLACHKTNGTRSVHILKKTNLGGGGLVHSEQTLKQQSVYYFKPSEWLDNGKNKETRCLLFATDIVLLGSLNDCDKHGIPQAFKYLSATSYKMPQNLVATNMQSDGYLFSSTDGTTLCSGNNGKGNYETSSDDLSIESNKLSFQFYKEWASKGNLASDVDIDNADYAISEASGIDWGVVGPNQGADNKSHLYHPGGHFLGIGCLNAETDIKSCVNLSRVCEIGATFSQRRSFLTKDGRYNEGYRFDYLSPTGLINNIDIEDSDFRRMFATLNYNGLRTIYDKDSALLKYDITPLMPFGFNGELQSKISNTSYISKQGVSDDAEERSSSIVTSKLFRYTNETPSADYYKFRLGTQSNGDIYNKYLKVLSNGTVSMPVYENSFYFYFGLKDGNTAFDRFLTDFYSQCPAMESKEPTLIVTATPITGIDTNDGRKYIIKESEVVVETNNLILPFTYEVIKDDAIIVSGKVTDTTTFSFTIGQSTNVENLIGDYTISLFDDEYTITTASFQIKFAVDSRVEGLEIITRNCTGKYTNDGGFDFANVHGSISELKAVYPMDNSIGGATTLINEGFASINNLVGNITYEIYATIEGYEALIGYYEISAPADFDFYVGNKRITGNRLKKYILNADGNSVNDDWFTVFKNSEDNDFTAAEREYIKNIFTMDASGNNNSIPIGCIGGTPPYTLNLLGCGESLYLDNYGNTKAHISCFNTEENNINYGFDIDLNNINEATNSNKKCNYYLNFQDGDSNSLTWANASEYTYNVYEKYADKKLRVNLFFDLLSDADYYSETERKYAFKLIAGLSSNAPIGESILCNVNVEFTVTYAKNSASEKFVMSGNLEIPSMYNVVSFVDAFNLQSSNSILEIEDIESVVDDDNSRQKGYRIANNKLPDMISSIVIDDITINSISDQGPFIKYENIDVYIGRGTYIVELPKFNEVVKGYYVDEHYIKIPLYIKDKYKQIFKLVHTPDDDKTEEHYNEATYKYTNVYDAMAGMNLDKNLRTSYGGDKNGNGGTSFKDLITFGNFYADMNDAKYRKNLYIPIPKEAR